MLPSTALHYTSNRTAPFMGSSDLAPSQTIQAFKSKASSPWGTNLSFGSHGITEGIPVELLPSSSFAPAKARASFLDLMA